MSNPTPLTPEQKEAYWLKRISDKANSVFPPFVKELETIVDMANHALTNDNKKKVKILIANQLGRPLTRIEITDEIPHNPTPPPEGTVHVTIADESGDSPIPIDQKNQDDQEHLRSELLPDAGGKDDPRAIDSSSTDQSGS